MCIRMCHITDLSKPLEVLGLNSLSEKQVWPEFLPEFSCQEGLPLRNVPEEERDNHQELGDMLLEAGS